MSDQLGDWLAIMAPHFESHVFVLCMYIPSQRERIMKKEDKGEEYDTTIL